MLGTVLILAVGNWRVVATGKEVKRQGKREKKNNCQKKKGLHQELKLTTALH